METFWRLVITMERSSSLGEMEAPGREKVKEVWGQ